MEVIKKYLPHKPYLTKGNVMFLLAMLVFGVAVPLKFAFALPLIGDLFSLGSIASGVLLSLLSFILSFLVGVAAYLAGFAGSFMDWVLNWNLFYTKCADIPADECFIDIAWRMTRDLVNVFLLVALVVIALFTILGSQTYGVKSAFIPFVLVALLVNFSRVIVGVVIDGSNLVMQIFVDAMPSFSNVSNLIGATGINVFGGNFTLDADLALSNLLQIIVTIVFFLGLAFILFLYGIIFAARFAILWMLTIMAPVAFLAYIFPSTKKIFNFWRDQLIQWATIGIPILFFLWIALLFITQLDKMKPPDEAAGMEAFFAAIIPNLMALLLLFIAFLFGMKTSAMGSAMIISTGKKWGKKAGMFGAKWSGKLGYRAGRMGGKAAGRAGRKAGKATGRYAGALGRRIGRTPPLRAVGAWRTGAARRRYDKKKTRRTMLKDANLLGQKDRKGRILSENTPWGALDPDQQVQVKEAHRSPTAKKAATVLGGGKQTASWVGNKAKYLASTPFKLLTPEEQQALWSATTFERFRKAKKKNVQDAMKSFEEKGLDDADTLNKTIDRESDPSKKLAAQILLSHEGEEFGKKYSVEEQVKITKEAKKLGLENEVLAHQGKGLIEEMYKGNALKIGQKMKKATSAATKAIKEFYEGMEDLEGVQLGEIAKSAKSLHEKIAATQRIADRLILDDKKIISTDEQKKLIETAGKFNQEHLILKRYLHKTRGEGEMKKVMGKMTDRDYAFTHEGVLKSRKQFEKFYKYATSGGVGQMLTKKELRDELKKFWGDATNELLLKSRDDINRFIVNRSKSNSPLSIPVDPVYKK